MEQLLFESDKKQANRIAVSGGNTKILRDGFQLACVMKNHQMQEFDKWKSDNYWQINHGTKNYNRMMQGEPEEEKSFSELFEIFEKETSK